MVDNKYCVWLNASTTGIYYCGPYNSIAFQFSNDNDEVSIYDHVVEKATVYKFKLSSLNVIVEMKLAHQRISDEIQRLSGTR